MAAKARALLLSLLTASSLFAQGRFGDRAPLTATRYTAFSAYPALVDNGRELFLFWLAGAQMRVTRLGGEARVGRPVMDAQGTSVAVVWTGSHFLAMGTSGENIVARLLDGNGEPMGAQYVVTRGRDPRLAFDGTNVGVLYSDVYPSERTHVLMVNRNGLAIGTEPVLIEESAGFFGTAIASQADGFGVLVANASEVRFVRLTSSGAIASQSIVVGATIGHRGRPALAGNGSGYLATWEDQERRLFVQLIGADGIVGRRFAIDAEEDDFTLTKSNATWNRDAWDLVYLARTKSERSEIRTMRVDGEGAVIGRGTPQPATLDYSVAPTSHSLNGHTFTAWVNGPLVVQDTTANSEPVPVAFGAAEQTIAATATSGDSLLVLWSEGRAGGVSWHQGIRTRAGTWTEREIDSSAPPYYAASDGKGFGVVKYHGLGLWSVSMLDAQGELVARSPQLDGFYAWGIASNGDGYVVVGPRSKAPRDIVAARVSASGVVSEPVSIASGYPDSFVSVTSDGTNYLAVLRREEITCVGCFEMSKSILGFRFNSSLSRLDAQNLFVAELSVDPLTVPNGNGWTVVSKHQSSSSTATRTRTIASNGSMSNPTSFIPGVTSIAPFGTDSLAAVTSIGTASIIRNGLQFSRKELGAPYSKPVLATLPGGGVAYIAPTIERSAPFHGSSRITMAIGDVVLPIVPDAPRATARVANGWAVVDWTSPAQRVTAYRVEYRVGDGSWNELEATLDSSARSIVALQPKSGVTYAFRVRAVNEGGAGAYSESVTVGGARRQVVRR